MPRITSTSLSNTIHTTCYDFVRLSEHPRVFNTITNEALNEWISLLGTYLM